MVYISFSAGLVLMCLGLARLVTTAQAVGWVRHHGPTYRSKLSALRPGEVSGKKLRELVNECDGSNVWPWGVLEYKLFQRSREWRIFGRYCYRLHSLSVFGLISYCFLGSHHQAFPVSVVWLVVAITSQGGVVLSAIEGIYAYITIGSFRRYYHRGIRLEDDEKPDPTDAVSEVTLLFPMIVSALAANILAFMVASNGWGSFSVKDGMDLSNQAILLVQALYFVSSTMLTVGYGDIVPKNILGELEAIAMQFQSALVVVGMFSALISFGLGSARSNS